MQSENTQQNTTKQEPQSNGLASKANNKKRFLANLYQKKSIKIGLLIILLIAIIGGTYALGYNKGYNKGFKNGEAKAKKDLRPSVPQLLNNFPNMFNPIQGKVTEITDKQITVQTEKKGKETIELTDKVKVNKKDQQLSITDIKKEQSVIVYTIKKDGKLTASRIVIK